MRKQVSIIPFRRDELLKFNGLEPTPMEIIESIDMMRILEHGGKIRMVLTTFKTLSVDTLQDLERVIRAMQDERPPLRVPSILTA